VYEEHEGDGGYESVHMLLDKPRPYLRCFQAIYAIYSATGSSVDVSANIFYPTRKARRLVAFVQ
jgi:hypothetical protein